MIVPCKTDEKGTNEINSVRGCWKGWGGGGGGGGEKSRQKKPQTEQKGRFRLAKMSPLKQNILFYSHRRHTLKEQSWLGVVA